METRTRQRSRETIEKKNKNPFIFIIDVIIRFRYFIGIFLLILVVALNLNGSSIGVWDNIVSQRDDGKVSDVIFGENREVRSDEWMVQTPFYLSQAETDYPVVNPDYGMGGQNMILAYNAPVKDISVIGKPFNWGFFFLGRDRGLSFYWGFKIIAMVLLGFELSMILTKRNKYLSLLGGFWIAFSPAVQWWFMQHLGDLVFFTLAIMVGIYHYLANHDKLAVRIGTMSLIALSGIGFILVIYPAFQVMLAYLILFYLLGLILHFRKLVAWDKIDLFLIPAAILLIAVVTVHFYLTSKEAIMLTMNTLYPGRRVSLGGGAAFSELFLSLTNWKIPFEDVSFTNNVEVSMFYDFFLVALLGFPFAFFGKKNKDEQYLGAILLAYTLFTLFWLFVGLPEGISKLSLLSYVPNNRALSCFHFGACLFSIWFIGRIWEKNKIPQWYRLGITAIVGFLSYQALSDRTISSYLNATNKTGIIISIIILTLLILFRGRKIFYLAFGVLIVTSGMFVNPVVEGTGAIYEKALSKAIGQVNQSDPNQMWLSEGELYNFTPALGVRTLNTVRFYPDMPTWDIVDPEREYEKYYNRYAHTQSVLTREKTEFILEAPDKITMSLSFKDAESLGVKYIVSKQLLTDYNPLNGTQFRSLYGPDEDGYSIYEIMYGEDVFQTDIENSQIGVN